MHTGNVPTKNKDNRALGRWVSTQRSMFKKFQEGDIHDMGIWDRRIRRLNGINFAWSLAPSSPPTSGGEDREMRHRGAEGEDHRPNEDRHREEVHGEELGHRDDGDDVDIDSDKDFSPTYSEEV